MQLLRVPGAPVSHPVSRLMALFLSIGFAVVTLGQSADLRVSLSGPTRVEAGEILRWSATVENLGPDRATDVRISVGVHPLPDCASETGGILSAGERRVFNCSGPLPHAYFVQISASVHSNESLDRDGTNNLAYQNVDIITLPDLIVGVHLPQRVDPGAAFEFDVSYTNLARTVAADALLEVTAQYPLTAVPANCTRVDERRASCSIATIDPSDDPWQVEHRFLHFGSAAPDMPGSGLSVTANIRAREGDALPQNNRITMSTRTYQSFYVTNAHDSGSGSLRAAIEAANTGCVQEQSEPCRIGFRISPDGAAWITIRPQTPLPAITRNGLVIDGRSQVAYCGHTNPRGPEIEINGSRLTPGNGLTFKM